MRILVMSDTHRRGRVLIESVLRAQTQAEVVFFLGDFCDDIADYRYEYTQKAFYIIRGNCDFYSEYPDRETVTLEGKRIFAVHGHNYGVKYGLDALYCAARGEEAGICLFGHTHIPHKSYLPDPDGKKGLYLLNPGSLGLPRDSGNSSYGIIDIGAHGIEMNVVKIQR